MPAHAPGRLASSCRPTDRPASCRCACSSPTLGQQVRGPRTDVVAGAAGVAAHGELHVGAHADGVEQGRVLEQKSDALADPRQFAARQLRHVVALDEHRPPIGVDEARRCVSAQRSCRCRFCREMQTLRPVSMVRLTSSRTRRAPNDFVTWRNSIAGLVVSIGRDRRRNDPDQQDVRQNQQHRRAHDAARRGLPDAFGAARRVDTEIRRHRGDDEPEHHGLERGRNQSRRTGWTRTPAADTCAAASR